MNEDGSIKETFKDANFWHLDGEFWRPEDTLIFNLLHIKEVPEKDGDTLFLDLVESYQHLKKNYPEILERAKTLQVKVDLLKIPDFS